MKFRSLAIGLLATAAILLLPGSETQAEPQYVINFGTMAPEGTPWSTQLQDIKKRVEAETNGAVQIKLFLGGSLGNEVEMVRDIRRGERLQGGGISTAALGDGANVPLLQLPELPYLFSSFDEADAVMDEVLWNPLNNELTSKGFVLMAWAENGWRSFGTKGPVNSLAQLQGYKMRSQEAPVHLAMWKALGVQAVAKPTSEVLPALSTGIVDGFDNTPLFSLAAGWLEETTHYTLSRHIYQPAAVFYSKRYWDTMPADLQATVMGDSAAESVSGRLGVRALEQELLQTMKEMGIEVVELDEGTRQSLISATASVHTDFIAETPGASELYNQVQAKLATMR
jgi:TRAP-type C4-dicarboxylate transport system substrate-binding protein